MNAKAAGPARKLLEEILAGAHELVLSQFLLTETARVLSYQRSHPFLLNSWIDFQDGTLPSTVDMECFWRRSAP
jgi:hypothetical protein